MTNRRSTTAEPETAWHRFAEDSSELKIELGGGSLDALLAEAGRTLGAILLGDEQPTPEESWRLFEVRSRDRQALLVDWLNELLFVAETELWVPVEIEVLEVSDGHLRARARGTAVAQAPARIKAATLHGLELEESSDGIRGEVILDL